MSDYDVETRLQALAARCADLETRCSDLEKAKDEAESAANELSRARASIQAAERDELVVLLAQAAVVGWDALTDTERREIRRAAGDVIKPGESLLADAMRAECPSTIPPPELHAGSRVYHRRSDLFAAVVEIDGDNARVRYEWPFDPHADPVLVPIGELEVPRD